MDEPDWNHRTPYDDSAQEVSRSVRDRELPDAFSIAAAPPADGTPGAGLSEVWDYLGKH